jgi:hypothetical protein
MYRYYYIAHSLQNKLLYSALSCEAPAIAIKICPAIFNMLAVGFRTVNTWPPDDDYWEFGNLKHPTRKTIFHCLYLNPTICKLPLPTVGFSLF